METIALLYCEIREIQPNTGNVYGLFKNGKGPKRIGLFAGGGVPLLGDFAAGAAPPLGTVETENGENPTPITPECCNSTRRGSG